MSTVTESFTGPAEVHSFAGLLFDMDGTLIDSTEAIVKHWHKSIVPAVQPNSRTPGRLGAELGVDPQVILATSHGRRSIDTLKVYDPAKANWAYVREVEGRIPKEYGADAVEIPGARSLLDALDAAHAPWAIVTSGTRPLMDGWLAVMKLAAPKHNVVAEDVAEGKPHPACYQLGKARLGLGPGDRALVIEDAPAGVRAGKAAGCSVVGLTTTHRLEQIREAGADWIVKDLRSVTFIGTDAVNGLVRIELCDTWVR
ncbi:hypothetical protein MMC26_004118 [Xylographa opegraphella]|nr:hypothetical protein [Xylographa opegraphella]